MAYTSFVELVAAAEQAGSIALAAIGRESLESGQDADALRRRMETSLAVMRDAAVQGITGESRSRSGLIGGDAKLVAESTTGPVGGVFRRAIALAVAIAETNASMGRVVAAPTGGASGVVPAVLLALAEDRELGDDRLVDALFTAGAIGAVMAARTNLSGAAAGCQAEIGAGAAMAAASGCELLGGTATECGHAASLALQGMLGLACDPVGGLVEVPCVMRNASGVSVALAGIEMARAGVRFPIPFDQVADALASIGRSMPVALRETAGGGLAATPAAAEIVRESKRQH